MRKPFYILITLLVAASMLLSACAKAEPTAEEPAVVEPTVEEPVVVEPTEEEPVVEEKVQIRWFVGLGTGSNPEHIPGQEAVIERFNTTHDDIELIVEFVTNEEAPDQLKTQIAAGDPPDIVGPVGWSGTNEFSGLFLDLEPYLGDFDWSDFDPESINAYRLEGEGLLGLPFAVFPSMIYYNRDLFDEAGLDYPPHKYGEAYADGDPWTVEKMEELAMVLTVDVNGNDANSPDFDPENIAQFGYHSQWTDPRGQAAALFGADDVVDANGDAVISERWRRAFRWYYEGMHEKYFMPSSTYQQSDLLAAGNPFDSGNIAMVHCHLWYTCCLTSVPNWDMAAVPSYNEAGDVTVKLHADTFRVFAATKHPEEAVEVLTWITGEGAADLLDVYGGMPGRASLQDGFFATIDERFPQGVDWQVAIDGLPYPDVPNHESNLPNYAKAYDRIGAFQTLYETEPGLDIDAELDKLEADLQVIFDEVK